MPWQMQVFLFITVPARIWMYLWAFILGVQYVESNDTDESNY